MKLILQIAIVSLLATAVNATEPTTNFMPANPAPAWTKMIQTPIFNAGVP